MRICFLRCVLLALFSGVFCGSNHFSLLSARAQSASDGPAQPGQVPQANPAEGSPGVLPGGAAMADFATLMNLIEQTIDPDSWLNAGGTSSMMPYPGGVYIDPKGQVRRLSNAQVRVDLSRPQQSELRLRHAWLEPSALRTVSLKGLDKHLAETMRLGLRPTLEVRKLAGLSRIEFVKVDIAAEDILIAGPAGAGSGFELEDMAVLSALISSTTTPLGCSIEPSDAGIRAAQQLLTRGNTLEQLARTPQRVMDQMQQAIGPHQVQVFGLQANTGTATALVDADEHMKRVGFGTLATQPAVKSYFDFMDLQPVVPQQSLIRWWFSYANAPIEVNPAGDTFRLPEQSLCVLSEQQWVTDQGRAPTGQQDPAADGFAEELTNQLPELRLSMPGYSRLAAIFESAVALQLGIESSEQPTLAAWFPTLCGLGQTETDVKRAQNGRGPDDLAPPA